MKKIAIFLRKELRVNRFSAAVRGALNSPSINNVIICSGFFQEDASYSVSRAKFNLRGRLTSSSPLNLEIFGYYHRQRSAFLRFLGNVVRINRGSPALGVSGYRIPGDKWHAKISIAKINNIPVFASIGSSNITRRAFDNVRNFNYECDVIFWDETVSEIDNIMNEIIGEEAYLFPSVIVANYDEKNPVNATPLPDRILELEREIRRKATPI
ncbi:phospholipase D-like domain-containing protein [Komagataeibacter medellinensis]|uniref:Phospholipase D-like domain-containing protein n=1 Tax=Komagataeibacter medellinensis (strain NBRC 3288 / BCRC 11682 / LMG 1693 / Kondo 51) TaxID=634177 RepID=G2I7Y5_KOMMN|nr:hypothetical protein [Komagataeibacter medellinensis]BAK86028.1 hypothetical protein GLX_28740 [Komagataeibacter medellinensis NBRC 3288]